MEKGVLLSVYDADYAKAYNERFLLSPLSGPWMDFELSLLQQLIDPDTSWLDVACGTGYFLSRFPDTDRAGLDLNPAMLQQAQQANAGVPFREADFRLPQPEWNSRWGLVSCMWGAYIYVDSLVEIDKLIDNMVNWLRPGGNLFLPTIDHDNLRPNAPIKYQDYVFEYGGTISMKAAVWDWLEHDTGKLHENLVSPHTGYFIQLLQPYFDAVEVVQYPFHRDAGTRKAVIAKGRRNFPDAGNPAPVLWTASPNDPEGNRKLGEISAREVAATLPHKVILMEALHRLTSGHLFKVAGQKIFRRKK